MCNYYNKFQDLFIDLVSIKSFKLLYLFYEFISIILVCCAFNIEKQHLLI